MGGRKYWLLVVDQFTSMKWSFFLKSKDKQASVQSNFVSNMQHQVKIKRWKFDNAGENKSTQTMFEKEGFGITCEYTARETPQQNGMVKQAFATLFGRVRALITNAGFEKIKRETLWAECAATATKLDNLLVKTSKTKNPYEIF
jgi:transposase InsO family protein